MRHAAMKLVERVEVEVAGLGEKIKKARKKDERSLKALCDAVGMSSQNWYRIEQEKQELTLGTLRKIELVLGVSFGVNVNVSVDVDIADEAV